MAWPARAAIFKGLSLGVRHLGVLSATVWRVFLDANPEPLAMGGLGFPAWAVNPLAAPLLLRCRDGDANVSLACLCSRNDVSGTQWPDLIVAALLAGLFLQSAGRIPRQVNEALRSLRPLPQPGE